MSQVQNLAHPAGISNDRAIHVPQHRPFSHRRLAEPVFRKRIVRRTALEHNCHVRLQLMQRRLDTAVADFLLA